MNLLLKSYKILIQILNMFISNTLWLCDVNRGNACVLCMLVAYCLLFLLAIESNDTECTEEGGVYEYQEEEDQVQANQDKPSIVVAYLILFT
jgi:hypothetical protein